MCGRVLELLEDLAQFVERKKSWGLHQREGAPQQHEYRDAAGREVAHFPLLFGAMSFFHNIPGLPVSGVGGLNMTGCILAKTFSNAINTWDDSEILAINPGLSVPTGQVSRHTKVNI